MYSIHNEEKLKDFLKENKIPIFRYAQIENNFFYYSLKLENKIDSKNWQTTKLLFKTKDWLFIESVIMRHLTWRNTLCVSSQAGCPMWCSFCSTWRLWLKRNLEFYEIIEQVYFVASLSFGKSSALGS